MRCSKRKGQSDVKPRSMASATNPPQTRDKPVTIDGVSAGGYAVCVMYCRRMPPAIGRTAVSGLGWERLIAMFRKLAALILVANYLAVATVGTQFHTHGPGGHDGCACHRETHCCSHAHGRDHAGCGNACNGNKPSHREDDSRPSQSGCDDCPICRFLAQKTLPIVLDAAEESKPIEGEAPSVRTDQPACPLLSLPLIRGPPAFG